MTLFLKSLVSSVYTPVADFCQLHLLRSSKLCGEKRVSCRVNNCLPEVRIERVRYSNGFRLSVIRRLSIASIYHTIGLHNYQVPVLEMVTTNLML